MRYFEDFVVGEVVEAGGIDVSQDDLIAFASRFDAQSFHTDPVAAKASFGGTLIGSGWHACGLLMRLMAQTFLLDSASMGAPGVEEVKWLRPLLPGEHVRLRRTTVEAKESRSRPQMGLVLFRLELLGRDDKPIVEQTNWIMTGRRGSDFAAPRGDWLAHAPVYRAPAEPCDPEPAPGETPPARFFEEIEVGESHELGSLAFPEREIVAFARAFDPQPFHMDAEAARASAFGGLCASGWHTAAGWMATMVVHRRRQEAAYAVAFAGQDAPRLGPSPGFRNMRWLKPVFVGDRITYRSTVIDKRVSASRPQWGLFFHRNSGVNQNGEEVFGFDGCVFVERRSG